MADFPCHHQSDTADFPCHHQSDTADFALPPMSRTPCPVVPNVLDIQHLHLRALYIAQLSWMNIAVCKQVSDSLTLDIVCIWKLTHSWTLYHLCDFISISIKQMSLSHHNGWYLQMWQKNYHNVLLVSSNIELAFFLCPILSFVLSWNKYFKLRLNWNVFWNHADGGEVIQSGIFVESEFSSQPYITHRVDHKNSGHTKTNTYKISQHIYHTGWNTKTLDTQRSVVTNTKFNIRIIAHITIKNKHTKILQTLN